MMNIILIKIKLRCWTNVIIHFALYALKKRLGCRLKTKTGRTTSSARRPGAQLSLLILKLNRSYQKIAIKSFKNLNRIKLSLKTKIYSFVLLLIVRLYLTSKRPNIILSSAQNVRKNTVLSANR